MGSYRALLFYNLSTIFILTLSISCQASDEDREVYIVYMGALPEGNISYSANSHHLSILENVVEAKRSVSNYFVRSFGRSFNGFVAKLTEEERKKISSNKEVVSVFPREIYWTQTTRSWDFMGFPMTRKRNVKVESDMIIGVLDSGIWTGSESFSDEGFTRPPKKWKGSCRGGTNFTCNNKIIGARYYQPLTSVVDSAYDDLGHGTHTASIAAGSHARGASFYGIARGTARGGVPSARIAAYKVCNNDGCFLDNILAAFDDAIADGVDIINISLGSRVLKPFEKDPIAIGSFHAATKGVLTVNSAGNNGPGLGTTVSVAPWLMSVAASSMDRRIVDKVVLGNGATFTGHSVNGFTLNGTSFPLIDGTKASINCSQGICTEGCLENGFVKGKIVFCDMPTSSATRETYRAGALGLILPDTVSPDFSNVDPLPTSSLGYQGFFAVISYLNSNANSRATILKSEAINDTEAPKMASFSGRGPNSISPEILKPDITAPGMEILAAFSPTSSPTLGIDDTRRVKYSIKSGTSMASPHVAGIAAYVKTFHPEWSPSAIKSAIMTTAFRLKSTDIFNGEFAYGSGHVNPIRALTPGLVYEALEGDFVNYLCSSGYDEGKVRQISGDKTSSCPRGSENESPRDLNYPSMTARVSQGEAFTVVFHRRVKNVGFSNSTYRAKFVLSPRFEFDVQVVPPVLSFKSRGEEKYFNVTVKGGGLPENNSAVSTSLVWSDGVHKVRSPIVLHNIDDKSL